MSKAQSVSFLLSQVRASGVALAGGEVEFFAAGTSTPKLIWLDRNKAVEAANPYTLDANGTAPLFGDGIYRVVIRDSTGVEKYDRDGLSFRDASNNVYDVADYASLAAAVASIGSTPATLQYAADAAVTANLVIPATLELMPLNGAKINHGAYTISYAGSTARWPDAQVFNGTGAVTGLQGTILATWFPTTTAGLQLAVNAAGANAELVLTQNRTLTSMVTVANDNTTIRFINGAKLTADSYAPANILHPMLSVTGQNVQFVDVHLDGANGYHRGITTSGASKFKMKGGTVENLKYNGITIGQDVDATTEIASSQHLIEGVTISNVLNDPALLSNSSLEPSRGAIFVTSNSPDKLVKNTTIRDCYIVNCGERGINFGGSSGTIVNNDVVATTSNGIYITGSSTSDLGRVVVRDNRIISGTTATVYVGLKVSKRSFDVKIVDNIIDLQGASFFASSFGMYLQGTSNANVSGNSVAGFLNSAIKVEPHPDPGGSDTYDIIIAGNSFSSNAAVCAISAQTASGGYVAKRVHWVTNTFEGNYNIALLGGHDDSNYTDNVFVGSASATDMMSLAASNIKVKGNRFGTFAGSAIRYEIPSNTDRDYVDTVIEGNIIPEVASLAPSSGKGRIQIVSPTSIATYKIRRLKIIGNTITGGRYGVMITGALANADNSTDVTINGNTISRTIQDGILARGVNNKIAGNTIFDFSQGSSSYSGIQINGDGNTVIGNTVENSGTYYRHINIAGGVTNRIVNNFLDANLIEDAGTTTKISGNVTLP